jgi:tripartite-type tricarboxylate transporter receptor subunit TctC
MENWYGVLAPAGLAPSMQTMLEKAILDVLASPDVTERFAAGACAALAAAMASRCGWQAMSPIGDRP